MSTVPTAASPAAERRAIVRRRILDAAWDLADRDGLAGWTLRDLAARVGMRAPSLYTHVDGKDAIHDAMFEEGWEQLEHALLDQPGHAAASTRHEALVAMTEQFIDFCTASVPRYQLLFTHALGEWQPTPTAYAASQRALDRLVAVLGEAGVVEERHVDIWTAVVSGLVAQQLANDRGGDRWRRLVGDAVAMFLSYVDRDGADPSESSTAARDETQPQPDGQLNLDLRVRDDTSS